MIILPSAKTMRESSISNATTPQFHQKASHIRKKFEEMSEEEIAKYFKIKGKTLQQTHQFYSEPIKGQVVTSLDGAVFKQINALNDEYIAKNIFVIDAMYGILNGNDKIDLFRLDFNLKSVLDTSYYNYWKEDVHNFINSSSHDQLLVLTSNEYTKLLNLDEIDKQVFEVEFDSEIKSSVHKKQIRGKIANYCIENEINDYRKLDNIKIDEYRLKLTGNVIYTTREN